MAKFEIYTILGDTEPIEIEAEKIKELPSGDLVLKRYNQIIAVFKSGSWQFYINKG
jgi:hypothetical protein